MALKVALCKLYNSSDLVWVIFYWKAIVNFSSLGNVEIKLSRSDGNVEAILWLLDHFSVLKWVTPQRLVLFEISVPIDGLKTGLQTCAKARKKSCW